LSEFFVVEAKAAAKRAAEALVIAKAEAFRKAAEAAKAVTAAKDALNLAAFTAQEREIRTVMHEMSSAKPETNKVSDRQSTMEELEMKGEVTAVSTVVDDEEHAHFKLALCK
jgi:hypothetical protein